MSVETGAGKIPTWALVLGTGIGLVFYAQREFMPRTETNLIAQQRDNEIKALASRDEDLTKAIKELAAVVQDSQKASLSAIEEHAKKTSHPGTAEQNAAVLNYLIGQASNQRQIYSVVQAMAQKQNIPAPPLVEVPLPQPSFPR